MSGEAQTLEDIINKDLANSRAEDALMLMDVTEARAYLTNADPIPDLDRHSQVRGVTYEPLRSMEVDGHKVAWMRISTPGFSISEIMCEHNFDYFVRNYRGQSVIVNNYSGRCWGRSTVLQAKTAVVAASYGFDTRNRLNRDLDFRQVYTDDQVEETIIDLTRRVGEGEWVGNWDGSFLGAMTVFNVLGIPRGGNEVIERVRPWAYIGKLVTEGKLHMSEDWVLTLPEK